MKKILLMVTCAFAFLQANAQGMKFGVHAGTDLMWYSSNFQPPFGESKMKAGFVVGGDAAYTFGNNVVLASGLDLLVSNGQFNAHSVNYLNALMFDKVEVKTMSLEIPLKAGYMFNIGKSVSLTPMVGVYGRYGLASFNGDVVSNIALDSPYESTAMTEQWKPYDGYVNSKAGAYTISPMKRWDFGCSVEVKLSVKEHYVISAGYRRGLLKQQDFYRLYGNSLRFTLGYVF